MGTIRSVTPAAGCWTTCQRFLYVIDGANHHVWILLRETPWTAATCGSTDVGR
jgi:hypothetical protein